MAGTDHRVDVTKPSYDHLFLRSTAWGTGAALALGVFVFAAQSQPGNERLQLALAGLNLQPAKAAAAPGPMTGAIEAKLDRLLSERERLDARLTALEHGLEDVTGSIRRQANRAPASQPVVLEPPIIPSLATLPPSSIPSSAPSEPATAVAAGEPAATPTVAAEPAAMAEPPATTDATEDVPLPRPRARVQRSHAEFGVELGLAPDLPALQARWAGVKANFGPLLVGLSPVAVRDKRAGSTNLRLTAGPLPSLTAARELCAKIATLNGYCWPARLDAAEIVQR